MKRGQLSDYFAGVVVKRLSGVEADREASNQHEFNGTAPLRHLLGEEDRRGIPCRFIRLADDREPVTTDGFISWYDARRAHPSRTEYRLYYDDNIVTALITMGDDFFLAKRRDGTAMVIITPGESTIQNQLLWLFGLDDQPDLSFTFKEVGHETSAELNFAARYILGQLGIEPEEPESDVLDGLIEQFGLIFPKTRVLSAIARASLPHVSAFDDPDAALLAWMEREEQLFRRLERKIVTERISSGFILDGNVDVDGFLALSLSVQNRRKSRVGYALENHLQQILEVHSIRYARGGETENRNKPDFLFPGVTEYRDPAFPDAKLTILGVKSTLKDRWRQVLSEAVRVQLKHLLTLEPGISENQTNEMRTKQLQLVLPKALHSTFRETQLTYLMTLTEFIKLVRTRQL